MMRVPVMLTCSSFPRGATPGGEWVGRKDGLLGQLAQERVGGGEPQRDTRADDDRGVDQAGQTEQLGLQLVHEFRLARRRLRR